MEIFLKAKHWQIFTLLIGVPYAIQMFLIEKNNYDIMYLIAPVMAVLYIVIYFGWFWAVGTQLNNKLPANVKLNLKRFKVLLSVPIIYVLGISIYISMIAIGQNESAPSPFLAINDIISVVFPLHIFAMFCIFYVLWFNAKTIKSIEFQRSVSFGDFAGDFFLLWLFPIGIWIIQPKINKMVENKK